MEIKVRAWDDINKVMVYPIVIKESFSSISSGDLLNKYENTMLQVGLINDKEIYVNDILRHINHYENGKPIYNYHRITYSEKYFCFVAINLDNKDDESLSTMGNVQLWVYVKSNLDFERVGNIYENKELLK